MRSRRRTFLRSGAAGLAALAAGAGRGAPPRRRPNLLLVLSDDHGIGELGCTGNRVVHTPRLNRLAEEGVRLAGAFTATAMCTPSRSMLYTGLFPHRNGAHPNHSAVRPGTKSLPHFVGPLGYRVALAGKRHIKPRECFPFDYLSLKDVEPFLAQAKRDGQPFCLVVALHDPHTPWKADGPHDPATVPIPPNLVDTPETRQAMARYYNSVTACDRQVGQTSDLLVRHGLDRDTLFLYASDHGSGFPFCKWTCYDAGLRVPFIARWPGRIRPGTVSNALVSFVDVVPTLVEAAGGEPPADLDGRSFLGVLRGAVSTHRDLVPATHTTQGIISGSVYPIRALRTATHKYIVNLNPDGEFRNIITEGRPGRKGARGAPAPYWLSWIEKAKTDSHAAERVRLYQHRPAEELYDLTQDPFELHNLAGEAAHRPLMVALRHRLAAWMKQQGDPLLEKMT